MKGDKARWWPPSPVLWKKWNTVATGPTRRYSGTSLQRGVSPPSSALFCFACLLGWLSAVSLLVPAGPPRPSVPQSPPYYAAKPPMAVAGAWACLFVGGARVHPLFHFFYSYFFFASHARLCHAAVVLASPRSLPAPPLANQRTAPRTAAFPGVAPAACHHHRADDSWLPANCDKTAQCDNLATRKRTVHTGKRRNNRFKTDGRLHLLPRINKSVIL